MNSLFLLIHSLTPTEKRYFKLFAQRQVQNKNTNYARIFDAINEQSVYNEEALLKKFRKETFINQFGVIKNYLFNMILSCMQQYNEENFIEWKIRNMFLQIKVLASKGLDKEAEKLIAKTKELAWKYEFYYIITDIVVLEKYLFGNLRIGEPTVDSYMTIEKEEERAFEIASTHQKIGNVWHYLTLMELEIGIVPANVLKQKADNYVNTYYMKQVPPDSYNSQFRYYSTWSLYYNLINDQLKNYECCKQGVLIREEQMIQQPLLNMDPLASYYNFLLSCEKADKWDEFEYYLQKIYQFNPPTIEVNIRRMHNYCWCALMYYLNHKEFEKAYDIVKEYNAFFVENKVVFRKDFKIYIEACCGLVCLFLKKYKEAMKWWNEILNNPLPQVELRTQGSIRLYLIMLHYDENNFDIIEYISKQAKKYLEQIAIYHDAEKLFLKQINDIINTIDKKSKNEKVTALYNQLSTMPLSISGNAVNKYIVNWVGDKVKASTQ